MLGKRFFNNVMTRFRYPVSLPEEVSQALGLNLTNDMPFEDFLNGLTHLKEPLTKLFRYMPRMQAEIAFQNAALKERFGNTTHICYYFNEGCLEFILNFDDASRLRRVYLQHKQIPEEIEMPLFLSSHI